LLFLSLDQAKALASSKSANGFSLHKARLLQKLDYFLLGL
jgi:hypothetical protein